MGEGNLFATQGAEMREWERWMKVRDLLELPHEEWLQRCKVMEGKLSPLDYDRQYVELLIARTWWATSRAVHIFRYPDLSEVIAAAIRSRFEEDIILNVPTLSQAIENGEPWSTVIQVDGDPLSMSHGVLMGPMCVTFDGETIIMLAEIVGRDGTNMALWNLDLDGKVYLGRVLKESLKGTTKVERDNIMGEINDLTYAALAMLWAVDSPITRTEPVKPRGRLTRKKRAEVAARRPHVKRVTLVPRPFHQPPGMSRVVPASSEGSCVPGRERDGSWAPAHTGIRWVREDRVREDDELLDVKERDDGKLIYACVRRIQGWGEAPRHPRKTVYNAVSIYANPS
jgi:hypothetical protein